MNIKKNFKLILVVAVIVTIAVATVKSSTPTTISTGAQRLAGASRYETAKAIAEDYNAEKVDNVILASGENFPDALAASTLSKKLNAPILLVSGNDAGTAMTYINAHVPNATGKIYIVGGTGAVGSAVETTLNQAGFKNITRVAGADRYDTDMKIVNEINAPTKTPVFIASGENFPDALAASSFAGANGYPIILTGSELAQNALNYLNTNKPLNVYVLGGIGAVSDAVENQIRSLGLNVSRLNGLDRYETAGAIVNEFAKQPQTVYLANGENFPDALAGSALAAKDGSPILLVDNSKALLPTAIETYLKQFVNQNVKVRVLGGTGAVSDILVQNAEAVLAGQVQKDPNNADVPEIQGVATTDKAQNAQTLATQLGFIAKNGYAEYNMYGTLNEYGVLVSVEGYTNATVMRIGYWDYVPQLPGTIKSRPLGKQVLKFYFPNSYEEVFKIVDDAEHGDTSNNRKVFTFDNRQFRLTVGTAGNAYTISDPGQTL